MPWGEIIVSVAGPIVSAALLWVGRKITKLIFSVDRLTVELTLMRGDVLKLHKRLDVNDKIIGDLIGSHFNSESVSSGASKFPSIHRKKDREH